jgi:hypothetical protein
VMTTCTVAEPTLSTVYPVAYLGGGGVVRPPPFGVVYAGGGPGPPPPYSCDSWCGGWRLAGFLSSKFFGTGILEVGLAAS